MCSAPAVGTSELAGVGTRPAYRGRGLTAAVTATLTELMFAKGNESVWLEYGGDGSRRVYERVGLPSLGPQALREHPRIIRGCPRWCDRSGRTTMDRMAASYLPEPTGPHPVGARSLYLNDVSRSDPWVPEMPSRELMVSVWYPAASATDRRAGYLTRTESELLLSGRDVDITPDQLSTVRTNAFVDAPPMGERHSLPLVLLSPGFTQPRATLTSIAEELASHGYLVLAIDHTYENAATTFPDGRIAPFMLKHGRRGPGFWLKVRNGRGVDVSFVLDELLRPDPLWAGAELIDPDRIGMAGHSVGGSATIAAMLGDPRIKAGSDIDGSTGVPIPDPGLPRPFLFLGRDGQYSPGDSPAADTWAHDWPRLTGWKRWLVVGGAAHASFTDLGLLADQFGIPIGAQAPGLRIMAITRDYLRAFLDLHLRDQPRPLLDRPDPNYPEVLFRDPV
jgi:dienelactone hydrolase